jgi:hypothetical protein
MQITDEMVDTAIKAEAAQARVRHPEIARFPEDYDEDEIVAVRLGMRAALEAVAPAIRAEALEEAAKVADDECITADNDVEEAMASVAIKIAAAIRAMAERAGP